MGKEMEVVLRNATVTDGTGAPSFRGDVGIRGDTIVAVGPRLEGRAELEVDCQGLVVAPGFIDIHNHSDLSIFESPVARNYVTQGVTTILVGNCGSSAAPRSEGADSIPEADGYSAEWTSFEQYLEALDGLNKALNVASLVGHGSIRAAVLGWDDVSPTPQELQAMNDLVEEAMKAGAFGLSTGLIYAPGVYAHPSEVEELARTAGSYGGIYAPHLRNESDLMVEAVMEALEVGRQSGLRVQISHHKASGHRNWGLVKTTLAIMEQARNTGVEVTCDVYPCAASSTDLYSLFPPWARQGGRQALARRLHDDEICRAVKRELARPSLEWENILFDAGYDEVLIARSEVFPNLQGKTLREAAAELEVDPAEAALELHRRDPEVGVVAGGMSEEDVRYILAHRLSLLCSDGRVIGLGQGCPHPRSYRAFTRALATYVRDEKVLGLEEAVSKASGLPAWKLGLWDRGQVRPGFKADLAVFDLWELGYDSDFGDPHHYSRGMVHVLVNGEFALREGEQTDCMPGRALRRGCPG